MKRVHMEPLHPESFLVRVGDENWCVGEPYEISLVVTRVSETECEVKGLDKPLTKEHWKGIATHLYQQGYREAIFARHKGTMIQIKRVTLYDYSKRR